MRTLLAIALSAFLGLSFAHAQSTAPVVLPSGCGTGNIGTGPAYLTVDSTGRLCDSGGGGSSPSNVNVSQFGGSPVVTGTGASGAGVPRVTVSSDSFPATQNVAITSPLTASGADGVSNNLSGVQTYDRPSLFNGTTWDRFPGNTAGAFVQGNVAAGVADSGNPVKAGGKYNATNPTLSDGNRGDLQLDANGNLRTLLVGTGLTPGDGASNAVAGATNTNSATTRALWVYPYTFNGTTWDRVRSDPIMTGAPWSVVVPTSGSAASVSHASTTALANNLNAKNTAGNLYAYNCTAITGAAAGYCIAYNGTATPGTGALTGANVLDFCFFDNTARGCSLSRIPMGAQYSAGIQILISSAASPYTYTTGTLTGAISADYK